jgi:PAS domain S-box-containing protein
MPRENIYLTGQERSLRDDEIIVSKTDPQGKMIYVNDVFLEISGYEEHELLGQPHSLIRHPEMPRCVFKLLWDIIAAGAEVFAYVNNRAKNGDNYWVLAHVTPNFDASGSTIVGYHSNRRAPDRRAVQAITPLYRELYAEEQRHSDRRDGLQSSWRMLNDAVGKAGFESYDRFVFSLING